MQNCTDSAMWEKAYKKNVLILYFALSLAIIKFLSKNIAFKYAFTLVIY